MVSEILKMEDDTIRHMPPDLKREMNRLIEFDILPDDMAQALKKKMR